MEHNGVDKETINKYSGGGDVKCITRTPELAKKRKDHRNGCDKKDGQAIITSEAVRKAGLPDPDSGSSGKPIQS